MAEKLEEETKVTEDLDRIKFNFDELWESLENSAYFTNKNTDVDTRILPRLVALLGSNRRGGLRFWGFLYANFAKDMNNFSVIELGYFMEGFMSKGYFEANKQSFY